MNHKTFIILSATLLIALSGCSPKSDQTDQEKGATYSKAGIRFDCPGGWQITEDKQILENEYFAVCEKQGQGESGLVLAKWTTNPLPAEQMLEILKNYYQKTYGENHGIEIKFEKIDEKNNRVDYSFKVKDIKHQGFMLARKCLNASAGLIFQEASEDHSKNKKNFENIEKSFACN